MRISIVCSDAEHPIFPRLQEWARERSRSLDVTVSTRAGDLPEGDFLFLISCTEIIPAVTRARYKHCLVVHASALPRGRGWSPHVWQILDGSHAIPVTLLEAAEQPDSGPIWAQRMMTLEGHELYEEINAKLFAVTLQLMDFAVDNAITVTPVPQPGDVPTYYPRRTPSDSRLDPYKTIAEQFELLRVADPRRFPCFIEHRGRRYTVLLKKEESP